LSKIKPCISTGGIEHCLVLVLIVVLVVLITFFFAPSMLTCLPLVLLILLRRRAAGHGFLSSGVEGERFDELQLQTGHQGRMLV
jgi:hypothetical protein